ncbi:uncharacterized protein PV09_00951 [Verruconis gallopava]|uniref:Rhodopsin domain-containing protein n=1 Tax=Verruconis gallopava TaxID=253628 RepID=A0A0D2ANF7_9PEZI|nr:uncharacterized protein PV09_00951 [Verruconis gallopava]KIW08005.1 hypothetical protein PV09_00951 [Verruconis gallopava]
MAALTPAVIATWPTPNYDDPAHTLKPAIWGIELSLGILMTIFIAGRFYSRTVLVKGALGADDWFILFAYILAISQVGCHVWEVNVGIGRHLYDVKFEWISSIGKITLVTQVLFAPTTCATKISICLTYLRIFPSKTNKWFNYGAIVLSACWAIACPLVMIFECWPISDQWNVFKVHKNCINIQAFFIAAASINAATDCLVYLWPIHYLINVNMPLRQRVGLIICFSVGVVVCVASLVRVFYMTEFFKSWDQTWYGGIVFMCLAFETYLGIICGCLPGVRPIVSKLFPRIFKSTIHRSGGNSGNQSWGKHLKPNQFSSTASSNGYRDIESIQITKDVELSVTTKAAEGKVQRSGSDSQRPLKTAGNEEWTHHDWS